MTDDDIQRILAQVRESEAKQDDNKGVSFALIAVLLFAAIGLLGATLLAVGVTG